MDGVGGGVLGRSFAFFVVDEDWGSSADQLDEMEGVDGKWANHGWVRHV